MKYPLYAKFLSSIIVLLLILSYLPVLSNASQTTESNLGTSISTTTQKCSTMNNAKITALDNSNTHTLKTVIESNIVQPSEQIRVSFECESVSEYTYHADGLTAIQIESGTMIFQLIPQEQFSTMKLTVTHEDGTTSSNTTYVYMRDSTSFLSDLSMDEAVANGLKFSYEQGYITQHEKEIEYANYTQKYIVFSGLDMEFYQNPETQLLSANTGIAVSEDNSKVIVHGYLGFKPNETTDTLLPLRYVEVQLHDCSSSDINMKDRTFTDENGYYYLECEAPAEGFEANDLSIRFSASAESFYLDGYTEQYYDYRIPKALLAGETNYGTLYLAFNEDSSLFRRMYLHQIVGIGQRLALSAGVNWSGQRLRIIYPSNMFNVSGCFWGYALIRETDWLEPDTLIHEYGHYVQQSQDFGIKLQDIFINPQHNMAADQLEDLSKSKEYAEKLVWTEAWASTFSNIAQSLYMHEYSGVSFNSANYYNGYNCEEPTISKDSNAFQEWAITALLWDLYDNPSISNITEAHDNIALTSLRWWQFTTQNGLYTLSEFMESAKTYYPEYLDEIGSIMAEYQISPGELSVTNSDSVSYNVAPVVRWRRNGSINNPNTVYQVIIYDAYNNELALCEVLVDVQSAYNDYMEFTIPIETWRQVLKYYVSNFEIQIAVKAWNHISTPMTGPYLSAFYSFNMDYPDSTNVTVYPYNRYYEKRIKLDKGQHHDFYISFRTGGQKVLQTFGNEDTKLLLYSTNGTLLASSDDEGYGLNAFIAYEVDADEQYIVRVKFYSEYNYGETKFSILTAEHILADVMQDFERYEDIYCLQNKTNHSFGGSIQKGNAEIFTFKPPVAGTYTFTIESDIDAYMYIIDPRTYELLVINVDYNDDSGEDMNPLLTKTLEAGVPYLIVITAFNPSAIESSESIRIIISST